MTDHIPVLSQEVIQFLSIDAGDTVLDGTVGSGGHAQAICTQLSDSGRLIGIDKDARAIEQAQETLRRSNCQAETNLVVGSFADAKQLVSECGVSSLSAVLLDLGFRSGQLASARGFSFQRDDPLLMTYKHPDDLEDEDLTAQEVLNNWSRESLEQILDGYANEDFASQIAEKITEFRTEQPIETTAELVEIVKRAVPQFYRRGSRHPATKTFQALRMAVNDEVRTLESGLQEVFSLLASGGHLVVISFHSVEDRIVKQFIDRAESDDAGTAITDKPVTPDDPEVSFNPRARSAKLRCLKKVSN